MKGHVIMLHFLGMNENLCESETPEILKLADNFRNLSLREQTKKIYSTTAIFRNRHEMLRSVTNRVPQPKIWVE